MFDYLRTEDFKKILKVAQSVVKTLPESISQVYERILNKLEKPLMVQKVLAIVLAARPLTLSEMNIAISMDKTLQTIHDIDLEKEDDFKSRLRSLCGLFVSVYHRKIYFLH